MYVNPHFFLSSSHHGLSGYPEKVLESREILVTCKIKAVIVLYFYYACLWLNENVEYGISNDSLICGTLSLFLPDAPLPAIEKLFGRSDLIQFRRALSMPEDFSLANINPWLTESSAFEKSRKFNSTVCPSFNKRVTRCSRRIRLDKQNRRGRIQTDSLKGMAPLYKTKVEPFFTNFWNILHKTEVQLTGR